LENINEDKITTSVYVDRIEWRKFQHNCPIFSNKKPNAVIDDLVREYNLRNEGKESPTVDCTSLVEQRLKYKKLEDGLSKILMNEFIRDRYSGHEKSVYEIMMGFAVSLGTDRTITKDIELVFEKLKNYELKPSDPFNFSMLESFIEYLDNVLLRRTIEAKIVKLRRNDSKPKPSDNSKPNSS
jgi:hypothetical protein